MDLLMALIANTIDPAVLPVPKVCPVPGEARRQETTGRGRQITKFVLGVMGPHNVLISSQAPADSQAIIDWEFVASESYATQHRIIEMMFRCMAPKDLSAEAQNYWQENIRVAEDMLQKFP